MTESEIAVEKIFKRIQERRLLKGFLADYTRQLDADVVADNVADTSKEKPDIAGINDWDEYWKHCTGQNLAGQRCASCGCVLDNNIRRGAHIRLEGEMDNTNKAWIALYCASCNNSRQPQKVSKGSWIVATVMAEAHKNVQPE